MGRVLLIIVCTCLLSLSTFGEGETDGEDNPIFKKPADPSSSAADSGNTARGGAAFSNSAQSNGALLGAQSNPNISNLNPIASQAVNQAGEKAVTTSLQLQKAVDDGEINDATRLAISALLAGAEQAQFNNAKGSSGESESSPSMPQAAEIPNFSSPELPTDSGSTSLPEVQVSLPVETIGGMGTSSLSNDGTVAEQPSAPSISAPVILSPSIQASRTNDSNLQNTATTPAEQAGLKDNKLKMSEGTTGTSNGMNFVAVGNDSGKISPTVAKIIMNALKGNAAKAAAKKPGSEAGRGLASLSDESAAGSADELSATGSLRHLEELSNIFTASALSNTRDLGTWLRTSIFPNKQKGLLAANVGFLGRNITLNYFDLLLGMFSLLSIFGLLIWMLIRKSSALKSAVAPVYLTLDLKSHYIDIEMVEKGGKLIALLTQYAKINKEVLKRGELLHGSIVRAADLPASLIMEYGFHKNDHVEYKKGGTWEVVNQELHIGIRPFNLTSSNVSELTAKPA